jgi:hypothetical protein
VEIRATSLRKTWIIESSRKATRQRLVAILACAILGHYNDERPPNGSSWFGNPEFAGNFGHIYACPNSHSGSKFPTSGALVAVHKHSNMKNQTVPRSITRSKPSACVLFTLGDETSIGLWWIFGCAPISNTGRRRSTRNWKNRRRNLSYCGVLNIMIQCEYTQHLQAQSYWRISENHFPVSEPTAWTSRNTYLVLVILNTPLNFARVDDQDALDNQQSWWCW